MACLSYKEYQERRRKLYESGVIPALKKQQFADALELFDTMKSMSYEEKIDYTRTIVKDAVNTFKDKIAVACSFGKDSVLVLYFALQVDPNIKVVFSNTGVEYKETYQFRDFLVKEWNLNYFETQPIKSYWDCVKEYGYPKKRSDYRRRKRGKGKGEKAKSGSPQCCYFLKERPTALWYSENSIEAILLGITWDESYQRRYLIIRYGDSYETKKNQSTAKHKVYPIAFWREDEVWRYIRENNIPYNKIYDRGARRCGCAPCTSYLNWDKNMAKLSPGLFRKVLHDQGGTQLSDFPDDPNIKRGD